MQNGDVDQIGERLPRDRLMKQAERKAQFHLDNDRLLIAPADYDIRRPDLGLHGIALAFGIALEGRVEVDPARGAVVMGGNWNRRLSFAMVLIVVQEIAGQGSRSRIPDPVRDVLARREEFEPMTGERGQTVGLASGARKSLTWIEEAVRAAGQW
jgi:hypothetical protein